MASLECGRQIKTEVQSVDDEVPFQKHDVKSEQSEADMFSEFESNGDAFDTNMPTNDLEENDELKVNISIDKFDPEQIKIEDNFFIPHLDLKSEECENAITEGPNFTACEGESFNHKNGFINSRHNHNESRVKIVANMTKDLKPDVGFNPDTGNILVEIKEETVFEKKEEIFYENIPSASDEMNFAVENDHVVKHEMVPTKERINEQYNSAICLNLNNSERLHSEEKPFQC
ncbi:uncharacterized protein [Leptinotarsa decemlineata]|uniref:uncharacterized protein n=1 Tax=Leptinotarsa decemlineata TaxID=7539 RepID=UPI003D305215